MGNFLYIENIHELAANVAAFPEIRLQARGKYMVASAMIGNPELYDSGWARECRGNVFGPHGLIVSRTLHKFFNVNERWDTQAGGIAWNDVVRVMQKRDGSMIHTVQMPESDSLLGRAFDIKSKKSFTSDVANKARAFLSTKQNIIALCEHVVSCGATAIMEYTAPSSRIVIGYANEKLTLLHVRSNITGEYWTEAELLALGSVFSVEVVTSYRKLCQQLAAEAKPFDVLRKLSKTVVEDEGWVVQLKNGEMYKVKTDWYMERHHNATDLRERNVAEMVLNESIDDLKAMLAAQGFKLDTVLEIEARVMHQLHEIQREVEFKGALIKGMDSRKAFELYGSSKYFKFIKLCSFGKEIDYKAIMMRELKERFQPTLVDIGAGTFTE